MLTIQQMKDYMINVEVGDATTKESEADSSCRVIGFTSAKGGVGTTTVALNVAMTFVQGGQKVILFELAPHLGTSAGLLKMPQISALRGSSPHLKEINQDFVAQLLMQHSTGLNILCMSPWAQEVGDQVSIELFAALFRELKKLADYLILDFSLEPSFPSNFFLRQCQIIHLVTEMDSICLALAKSQLPYIRSHCDSSIIIIPVNRAGIPPADGLQGIQHQLGNQVPVLIPPAPELCYTAGMKGLPIVCINPNSILALQFLQLREFINSYFTGNGSGTKPDRRGKDRRKGDRRNRGGW